MGKENLKIYKDNVDLLVSFWENLLRITNLKQYLFPEKAQVQKSSIISSLKRGPIIIFCDEWLYNGEDLNEYGIKSVDGFWVIVHVLQKGWSELPNGLNLMPIKRNYAFWDCGRQNCKPIDHSKLLNGGKRWI